MEAPLCVFDLRSGTFCSKCEEKLRKNEVTDLDVKIMRQLLDAEKSFPPLQTLTYINSVETSELIAIVTKSGDLSKFSPQQISLLRKKLTSVVSKPVRFMEDIPDPNEFLEALVTPARIITINKIWLPDQTTVTRIILDSFRGLRTSKDVLIELALKIKGISLRIDFDRVENTPIRSQAKRYHEYR